MDEVAGAGLVLWLWHFRVFGSGRVVDGKICVGGLDYVFSESSKGFLGWLRDTWDLQQI